MDKETITLTIDGEEVQVQEGQTVLDAAKELGVWIPTLCYHEALEPQGACRLCLVEIEMQGRRQLVASCAQPATEGMKVFTDTEKYQLILARKCSERLSLQFLPTLVHQNLVKLNADPNDTFAAGISGRYKISARATFNAEYFYIVNPPESVDFTNPLSLGFSFDTGGHIFQINFSNAPAMTERHALTQTAGSWMAGDFALGFSIYRTFSF